jgi:hypothetical protein
MTKKLYGLLILTGMFVGCEKNPVDRLTNPMPDGALSQTSGTYVVYDDELRTGGGLGYIPGGENQTADVSDFSSPRRTISQLRYSWNGQDVSNGSVLQHLFAGFSLPITSFLEDVVSAQPKNLSGAGYTKVRMQIRGTLSDRTAVRIEGPDDGAGGIVPVQVNSRRQGDVSGGDFVLTNEWQQIEVPANGQFSAVKIYLTVSFQFSQPFGTTQPGGGGEIFLDDIHYVQ